MKQMTIFSTFRLDKPQTLSLFSDVYTGKSTIKTYKKLKG